MKKICCEINEVLRPTFRLTFSAANLTLVKSDVTAFSDRDNLILNFKGKPSDMWALGVVLFTMLYGQFSFYNSVPQELFRKIKAISSVCVLRARIFFGEKEKI